MKSPNPQATLLIAAALGALAVAPVPIQAQIAVDRIDPLTYGWSSVSITGPSISDPVVIAGPPTHRGDDPGVLRIKNVGPSGFDARFREWAYRKDQHGDEYHVDETVYYILAERGRTTMPDNSVWVAGTFDLDGAGDWEKVSFPSALPGEPKLFLTAQTAAGDHPVAVQAKQVSATGFQAALIEEERFGGGHTTETVGYLAIYSPSGRGDARISGSTMEYALSEVEVSDQWKDLGWAHLQVEEEKSVTDETGHKDEEVHVLEIGPNGATGVFAQQATSRGGDPAALRMSLGDPDDSESAEDAGAEEDAGGWYLASGEPSYSEVTGRKSDYTSRLDLEDEFLRAVRVGENSDRPCHVRITGEGGASLLEGCPNGFPTGSRRSPREASLGQGAAVRAIRTCSNQKGPFQRNYRVKGVWLEGNRILDDGSFDDLRVQDKFAQANCQDESSGVFVDEWDSIVRCGKDEVATGVIAHFEILGRDRQDLRGFQLICRKVVREGD